MVNNEKCNLNTNMEKITVKGREIIVITTKEDDYISLTNMAGYKDELEARVVVSNWMITRFTFEFLEVWEQIYNPNFNRMEYHTIKNEDGRLVLTPKRWVERTNAIYTGRQTCTTQQRSNYANAFVGGKQKF